MKDEIYESYIGAVDNFSEITNSERTQKFNRIFDFQKHVAEIDIVNHHEFMKKALKLAEKSLKSGDVPIGALIVYKGKIVGRGWNKIELKNNPLEHAELIAIKNAAKTIGHKHLLDCEMYITLEPCSMCAGAIVLSRVPRVFIGASDSKSGAAGSIFNILQDSRLNHRCEVKTGILSDECSGILKDFFKKLRKSK